MVKVLNDVENKNGNFRYSIPRNKDCQEIWLTRINNKLLFDLEDRQIFSYKVCASHFEETCLINGRLRKFALPTMNLLSYKRTNDCFLNRAMFMDNGTPNEAKGCNIAIVIGNK